jgi:hypothetical protein
LAVLVAVLLVLYLRGIPVVLAEMGHSVVEALLPQQTILELQVLLILAVAVVEALLLAHQVRPQVLAVALVGIWKKQLHLHLLPMLIQLVLVEQQVQAAEAALSMAVLVVLA